VPCLLALAMVAALIVGCDQSAPPDVVLTSVDRDAYDALVAGHRGQVVLVDFWATWCVPCVEQFSHTVELARRYRNGGLAVISVNMDDSADAETVVKFLRSQNAGELENLVSQDGGGPRSMTTFEISGGALPHYKLYDRTGRLRHTFALDPAGDRQFSLQDVDAAVEQLLAE
jgi:thiol-disulfide isomerase/thioredoxin